MSRSRKRDQRSRARVRTSRQAHYRLLPHDRPSAVVDNNVLSRLVREEELALEFLQSAAERRTYLVMPDSVIIEFLGGDPDEAIRSSERLLELSNQFPEVLVTGADIHRLLELERHNIRPFEGAQRPSPGDEFANRYALIRTAELVRQPNWSTVQAGYLKKREWLELDKDAQAGFREEFPHLAAPSEVRGLLENFRSWCMKSDAPFFTMLAKRRTAYESLRRWRRQPAMYRVPLFLGGYLSLNALGACFADTLSGRLKPLLVGPKAGEAYDARIAACSVHCGALISDDETMRCKTNFVARALGYRVRAVSVADWLESPKRQGCDDACRCADAIAKLPKKKPTK